MIKEFKIFENRNNIIYSVGDIVKCIDGVEHDNVTVVPVQDRLYRVEEIYTTKKDNINTPIQLDDYYKDDDNDNYYHSIMVEGIDLNGNRVSGLARNFILATPDEKRKYIIKIHAKKFKLL